MYQAFLYPYERTYPFGRKDGRWAVVGVRCKEVSGKKDERGIRGWFVK